MGWIHRVGLLFKDVLGRSQEDAALQDEIQYHVEMETADLIASGVPPAEARRQAMLRFGGVDRFSEQTRDVHFGRLLDLLRRDLRQAFRLLRKSPGFTAVAIATVALGIGANTAIFSVVNAVLLRPLPYGAPESLLRIRTSWEGSPTANISPAEFLDYEERLDGVADVGVYAFGNVNVTGDGPPERVRSAFVSRGALDVLAVPAVRGRWFTREEDVGRLPVVLIDEGLWQRRLGGDPDAVGKTLTVDGNEVEIVGIMPGGFRLPEDLLAAQRAEFFFPLGIAPGSASNRGSHFLAGVARPVESSSSLRVAESFEASGRWMVETFPDDYPQEMRFQVTTVPLDGDVRGPVRKPIVVLLIAVGLVLLIACVNVANLLLARADGRAREFAVRSALGASGRRLAGQLVVESLVLAGLGGALGGLLALVATRALSGAGASSLPWLQSVQPDGRVLAFTALATLLTGLAFGLVPALQAARRAPSSALRDGDRAGTALGGRRLRSALVVGELAFALVLLAGAALLGRSFRALLRVDPGYATENLLTGSLSLPGAAYTEDADVVTMFREVASRAGTIPGVEAAGLVSNLPLATRLGDLNFRIEGRPVPEGDVSPRADWQVVTPGYFEAMGLRLVQGRFITNQDGVDAVGAVVISQSLAATYWPGEDPMGTRFELGGGAGPGWVTVVGIVADVRHLGLDQVTQGQMYLPHEQFRFWGGGGAARNMTLVVRSPLPPHELRSAVEGAVGALDSALPVARVRTMAEVRRASTAIPRVLTALVSAFSVLALLLTAVGLYGVVSYAVNRRVREFGIRSALGAPAKSIRRMVLRDGLVLAAWGVGLGAVGVLLGGRVLTGVLYSVEPTDPTALVFSALMLTVVALFAAYAPAHRATRVDPASALRVD